MKSCHFSGPHFNEINGLIGGNYNLFFLCLDQILNYSGSLNADTPAEPQVLEVEVAPETEPNPSDWAG